MGRLFSLKAVSPMEAAQEVISRFIEEAETNKDKWAEKYKDNLDKKFLQNEQKIAEAAAKLGVYYSVLAQHAPEIGRVYDRIKQEYRARRDRILRELKSKAAARAVTPLAVAQA